MIRISPRGRTRGNTFTKVRAVLAGALVLGVGTTLTLAAWTDSENATAAFGTSVFVVESQTAASPWAPHEAANPATLSFNASAMSPSVSFFASVDVRTTAATNVGGTVALSSVTVASGTLLPQLEYRVVTTPAATACAAAAFSGQAYNPTISVGAAVPAASGTLAAAGGSIVRFCFDVRVKAGTANSFQGTTATATWQFTATSSS